MMKMKINKYLSNSDSDIDELDQVKPSNVAGYKSELRAIVEKKKQLDKKMKQHFKKMLLNTEFDCCQEVIYAQKRDITSRNVKVN